MTGRWQARKLTALPICHPVQKHWRSQNAFAFEVFEKYTSTYFELNQFLLDNMFNDEPMFDEIKVVLDEDTDLASIN